MRTPTGCRILLKQFCESSRLAEVAWYQIKSTFYSKRFGNSSFINVCNKIINNNANLVHLKLRLTVNSDGNVFLIVSCRVDGITGVCSWLCNIFNNTNSGYRARNRVLFLIFYLRRVIRYPKGEGSRIIKLTGDKVN